LDENAAPKENPIKITDRAAKHLKEFIDDEKKYKRNAELRVVLRIGVGGGGCAGFEYIMRVEAYNPLGHCACEVFTEKGIEVCVDKKGLPLLAGTEIDWDNFRPVFRNPNAGPTCGCGESFAPKNDDPNES